MLDDMPRGGKREGAGRKSLPDSQLRSNATVKMLPATKAELTRLAHKSKTSGGRVIEFLMLAPEAKPAREACITLAKNFDGQK